ncbi:MAG TPA: TonB-dependent receptor plug domain-containing protein [Geminicoccus sp.]|jgi:hypothetical protein|uniref:TonB-dependent receptor plug domain-containing protein n=1 Tax=Geminicoccus sp. TaxID=2024832 RepID=UPI002E30C973|nr:TonB-dependent receptor plug domain-containing protein [Geminicoccus sp.]HEX2527611.1 TonB-dependent receptor plug domain-containing protein [Geminicoccus sp.]
MAPPAPSPPRRRSTLSIAKPILVQPRNGRRPSPGAAVSRWHAFSLAVHGSARTASTALVLLALLSVTPAQAGSAGDAWTDALLAARITPSGSLTPSNRANLEIIRADRIQAALAQDVPSLLQEVAGIDLSERTSPSPDAMSIGGYAAPRQSAATLLVNGQEVRSSHSDAIGLSSLPIQMDEIRQIEILRSSDAPVGREGQAELVNIITADPALDGASFLSATIGNDDVAEDQAPSAWRWSLSAGWRSPSLAGGDHGADPGAADTRDGIGDYQLHLASRTLWRFSEAGFLELKGHHAEASRAPISSDGAPGTELVRDKVAVRFASDSPFGFLQARAYTDRWFDDRTGTGHRISAVSLDDAIVPFADNVLVLAGEVLEFASADQTSRRHLTASATWNWAGPSSLSAKSGIRLDQVQPGADRHGQLADPARLVSYHADLVWQPSDRSRLRLQTRRGTRLPPMIGGGWTHDPVRWSLRQDPDLHAETASHHSLDYEQRLGDGSILWRSGLFIRHDFAPAFQELDADWTIGSAAGIAPHDDVRIFGGSWSLSHDPLQGWRWGVGYGMAVAMGQHQPTPSGVSTPVGAGRTTTTTHVARLRIGHIWGRRDTGLFAQATVTPAEADRHDQPSAGRDDAGDETTLITRIAYRLSDQASVAFVAASAKAHRGSPARDPEPELEAYLTLKIALAPTTRSDGSTPSLRQMAMAD